MCTYIYVYIYVYVCVYRNMYIFVRIYTIFICNPNLLAKSVAAKTTSTHHLALKRQRSLPSCPYSLFLVLAHRQERPCAHSLFRLSFPTQRKNLLSPRESERHSAFRASRTRWRRYRGCRVLQVSFHKRNSNHREHESHGKNAL